MDENILVSNLPRSAGIGDIGDLFEEYGVVDHVRIIMDRDTGLSRGFGFVEMPDSEDAAKAIEALDGEEYRGRRLIVNEVRPRPDRRRDRGRW